MGHARALISVENAELQVALTRQVVDKQLSVRELERLIQKLKHRRPPRLKRPSDPNLEALEEELLKALGTKVVLAGSKSKGVIKIFYFSMDELNRLYDHIKGARR